MDQLDEAATERERSARRRDRLRTLMDRLEVALAEPARRDLLQWRDDVAAVVGDLRVALEDHAAETEAPGGLFDDVTRLAPRLTHQVGQLRSEHPELLARAATLQAAVTQDSSDEVVATARSQGIALLGQLVRHRHAGSDLLYEAYWVDVAVGD